MRPNHTESQSPDAGHSAAAARWLLVVVAILWSSSGLFAKAPWLLAWPVEVRGPLLAFWRTLFAGLFLLPLVRQPRWSWRMIPTALIFACMNVTFMTAMARTTTANAVWLQNTAPIWVLLFGVSVRRQPISRRDVPMLACGLTGIAFILTFELSRSMDDSWVGIGWGILAGLTYAAVIVTVRWLREYDSAWIIAVNHLVTAALLAPLALQSKYLPTWEQTAWVAAFGIIQMGIPYTLFARALRRVPSHEASVIVLLEPILAPVGVWLAWRTHPSYQPPAWWTIVGAAFILAGLVYRYGRPRHQVSKSAAGAEESPSSQGDKP